MESTGDNTLSWAVTRFGQVVLFWGALGTLLKALDVLTDSDLLAMLRLSLGPGLGFLAEPWTALFLFSFGILLIWRSNRPRRIRKSVLDQNLEPEQKNYSIIRAAGVTIPLFLALVCGMAFGGFEWSSPTHGQIARGGAASSANVLSGAVHRRPFVPQRLSGTGLPAPSSETSGTDQGTDTLASSVPRLTPELEDGGPTLASQLPADPRAAIRAYAYNGARIVFKSGQPTTTEDTSQRRLFDQFESARANKNWWLLATLSEKAIEQTPQWLTPYLFAGEAYANLGRVDRAIRLLEYVKKNGAGNPDYDLAIRRATEIRQSIRQQYGR